MHRTETTAEFKPKRIWAYRMPECPNRTWRYRSGNWTWAHPTFSQSDDLYDRLCGHDKWQGTFDCGLSIYKFYTLADAYPVITVNKILNKVGYANYISLFDSNSGYWQIPLTAEDQWKTALVTLDDPYEWTRIPLGFRNAGTTFVTATKTILRPFGAFADTYVDDMSVGSRQWSQHMCHVRQYLQVISDAGLTYPGQV